MGLLDKVKNLFTEEVEEEEIKPIKNEVRHIEVEAPKRAEREIEDDFEEEVEEKKEDKFVFFSDDDFKDLEKKDVQPRPIETEKPKQMYRSTIVEEEKEEKSLFRPSPIISPVYGVLDKNYSKDEVVTKKSPNPRPINRHLSVDDVRRKAYGTIEDDFKETFEGKAVEPEEVGEVSNIDIFEELEKYDNLDALQERIDNKDQDKEIDVDDLFDSLDNKKDEIIEELDNKKEEILDELDSKKEDIITNDNDLDDLDLDEETLELSRQLESQKKHLDEINDIMSEDEEVKEEEPKDDDLNESELFDLIDSMYDKKDDE